MDSTVQLGGAAWRGAAPRSQAAQGVPALANRRQSPKVIVPALTGIRGVAALVIVAYHLFYPLGGSHSHYFPGYLAVDLFFVLSGFVMALTYAGLFKSTTLVAAYKEFLHKRFARIYPVYFVFLVIVYLANRFHLLSGERSLSTFVGNAFLVQTIGAGVVSAHQSGSIVGSAWSISTELAAYLLFPALVSISVFRGARSATAAAIVSALALCLVASCGLGIQGPLDVTKGTSFWPLIRCLSEFTVGLMTWRVWRRTGDRWPRWSGAIVVASIFGLSFVHDADLLIASLFPVLVFRLAATRDLAARFFGLSPVVFLGDISYSLYIIHNISVDLAPKWTALLTTHHVADPRACSSLTLIIADCAFASLSYYLLERPARRLIMRAFGARRPPSLRLEPAAP